MYPPRRRDRQKMAMFVERSERFGHPAFRLQPGLRWLGGRSTTNVPLAVNRRSDLRLRAGSGDWPRFACRMSEPFEISAGLKGVGAVLDRNTKRNSSSNRRQLIATRSALRLFSNTALNTDVGLIEMALKGLKIPWGSPPVWVRFPPPAPAFARYASFGQASFSLARACSSVGAAIRRSTFGALRLGLRARFPPMLFRERGTVGGPITTASVAFDPDVAAMRAVPVEVALSIQNERRDTDIPRDCAARADGIPYDAAFSAEEVSRWRWWFVVWIVGRHQHASVRRF